MRALHIRLCYITKNNRILFSFINSEIFKIAEWILKLDAGDGFEPPMLRAYETAVVTTLPA